MSVRIDELVRGTNIALGLADLDECPALDLNSDGSATIDELITAENNASGGATFRCRFPVKESGDVPALSGVTSMKPHASPVPRCWSRGPGQVRKSCLLLKMALSISRPRDTHWPYQTIFVPSSTSGQP